MYIVLLCVIFSLVLYICHYCRNPYYLHLVVGSKGSGKSLYLASVANKWLSKRLPIYSNMGIGMPLADKYWLVDYPPDSLILIDEIGVIHPDRAFKSFDPRCMEWYKMSRKRRLTIVASSQTMDVDKKIRDLCDRIFVVRHVGPLCHMRAYRASISMVETAQGGHDLVNDIRPLIGSGKWYTVPKTVATTSRLGYETQQIISRSSLSEDRTEQGKA